MNKILILSVLFSFLLTGCTVHRSVKMSENEFESLCEVRVAQEYAETFEAVVKHTDLELETIITVDEFDTDQPADPATGTPPLKRRKTAVTKAQVKETTAVKRTEIESTETKEEIKQERQTNEITAETAKTETVGGNIWCWLKFGVLAACVVLVLLIILKNKIKNLLKPL